MIGTTLLQFKITAKLGEGGMGQVFEAEDTKLGRRVAIKVLPQAFTQDQERLARFEREAKVLASVEHPNIAGIHQVEEVDGVHFLVMELAEGETLNERIARGALPIEEALRIALQIAEALEAAHERGVIHRDLKPANVKVSPQGQVKVLDFGLAKAVVGDTPGSGSQPSLTMSPTLTAEMTEAGVLLGTAAYMSPEQARAEEVDRRADLWAFGVVLMEMLTGHQLFSGKTLSDTLAGVLRDEPAWAELPAETPSPVRRLLRRCLEREARHRLADATSARLELEDAMASRSDVEERAPEPVPTPGPQPAAKRLLPWALFAAAAAALAVALIALWPEPAPTRRPVRLEAALAQDALWVDLGSSVVLSPDGSKLAFVTGDPGIGESALFIRSLDQLNANLISSSTEAEAPYHPFFAPDGAWLGFVTRSALKKVPISGGTPSTLCAVDRSRGASWGPGDTIVFAPGPGTGLSRVSAVGGEPETLTTLAEDEISHRWPQVLPNGKAALFSIGTRGMANANEAIIGAVIFETGERKVLVEGGYYARYVPTGHLVFIRDSTLFAVPFDPERLELTGSPAPMVQRVTSTDGPGGAQYSFADDGTLAYIGGEFRIHDYPIVWVDRKGDSSMLWEAKGVYASPALSPEGKRLALSILRDGNWDVWVYDLEREVATRLTFHEGYDADQLWTPDGEYLIFASDRGGTPDFYRKRADGSGEAEQLTKSEVNFFPTSVSPDGRTLMGELQGESIDIAVLTPDGSGEPEPFLATTFRDRDPEFSPNGRWVAYASDESGQFEIYVRPYPLAGGRWQVSDGGGRWPAWSTDGSELFYRTNEGLMVASVDTRGETFQVEKPRMLIQGRFRGGIRGIAVGGYVFPDYAVSPDGQRFVMFPDLEEEVSKNQVTLVFNWFDELRSAFADGSR